MDVDDTLTEPGAGNPKESDKEQAQPVVEETPQPLPKPPEKPTLDYVMGVKYISARVSPTRRPEN